jgi:hypothetical protein
MSCSNWSVDQTELEPPYASKQQYGVASFIEHKNQNMKLKQGTDGS